MGIIQKAFQTHKQLELSETEFEKSFVVNISWAENQTKTKIPNKATPELCKTIDHYILFLIKEISQQQEVIKLSATQYRKNSFKFINFDEIQLLGRWRTINLWRIVQGK